jgi:Oxysterol-binding protein
MTKDFWAVSEQVSHHPPISAIHLQGSRFKITANSNMKLCLTPGGLSIKMASPMIVQLLIDPENETWEKYEL